MLDTPLTEEKNGVWKLNWEGNAFCSKSVYREFHLSSATLSWHVSKAGSLNGTKEKRDIWWERKGKWIEGAGETGRGRSQRPCDGRWHRSSVCGQGKQLKMKQTHRQGSVCRCPLTAPLPFIPHPLPHCPRQPRLLSTNQGTRGRRHSGDTSKPSLGERLRADAGTTQRSTEESRDGQLEKRSPNGMEKRSPTRTKHFILFTNQHYASQASPKTQTHFSHCLEPMAPLSMWTRGII